MNKLLMKEMIKEAKERFGKIRMLKYLHALAEHFTIEDGIVIFWFEKVDGSSEVVERNLVGMQACKE